MNRQLEFWVDGGVEVQSEAEHGLPELKAVTETAIAISRTEASKSIERLFTNPNRQCAFGDKPHHEWPEPDHDRDTITVDRTRDDIDGPSHRFVIKRHDQVEVFLSKDRVDYGTVVGISHARHEVRVRFEGDQDETWFDVGSIYPAPAAVQQRKGKSRVRNAEIRQIQEGVVPQSKVTENIDAISDYVSIKVVSLTRIGTLEGRPRITSTVDACQFFAKYWEQNPGQDQERFVIACLDTKHCVQSVVPITVGTLDASLVHPREVFKPAILEGSSAILLSHNHPSGDPAPSREDHQVTERLTDAGKLIGITVLDHVIHGDGSGKVISIRES